MSHTLTVIADTLKTARVNSGKSQGEVAEQLGVSRSWISQFERGMTKGPALDRILTLAHALDVTVSFTLPAEGAAAAEVVEVTEITEVTEVTLLADAPDEDIPVLIEPVFHHTSGLEAARALQGASA